MLSVSGPRYEKRGGGGGGGGGGAVGFWPDTKSGWGWGVLSVSAPIRRAGGGGGGEVSGPMRKAGGGGGGGGVLSADTKSGGGGGGDDRVSGSPGYSTVVEFMRTGINRQRKRAATIIKCSPNL